MYALGTIDREVELSNSAKTGMTSPVETKGEDVTAESTYKQQIHQS